MNPLISSAAILLILPLPVSWLFKKPRWAWVGAITFGAILGALLLAIGIWLICVGPGKAGGLEPLFLLFGLLLLVGAFGLCSKEQGWHIVYAMVLMAFSATQWALFGRGVWGEAMDSLVGAVIVFGPIAYGLNVLWRVIQTPLAEDKSE